MQRDFDLIVIGAGSGGLAAAFRAAKHGAKVAMFDPAPPGGTCIHRGCVPKKAMWYAAQLAQSQRQAREYGFALEPALLDWPRFFDQRAEFIDGITHRYTERLEKAGITRIERRVRLTAADAVTDAQGNAWRAPHLVIATGARPRRLDLPGFDLGLVSDDMFTLRELPHRFAIVGAGYVGVEFAGMLRALGHQVTLLANGHLLERFDAQLTEALAVKMQEQGITLVHSAQVSAARKSAAGITLEYGEKSQQHTYDAVLWAVGRVPNSDDLGLDALGVERDKRGHVVVDGTQATGVPGIYAIGDVTNHQALTPVAVAAGRRLCERLFGGDADARMDYDNVPSAVFSSPPLATVGLTEAKAREQHGDAVTVNCSRFTPLQYAVTGRSEPSLVKLVCLGQEQRVVGVHILGPGAEEMVQGFAVAVRLGARKRDLDQTIPIHPSSAEELLLLG